MKAQDRIKGSWLAGRVGFQLAHEQFTAPEPVRFGLARDPAGFAPLAVGDHAQPWQANQGPSGPAWITISAIDPRTKPIRRGTTVTCPTFRYNSGVVAQGFASLSLLHPGGIFLGIGSGQAWNEEAAVGSWLKWPEPSRRFVEAAEIIRELWGGQPSNHSGKFYNVHARLYHPPPPAIPLMMAGNGRKAICRCGQYGDGLIADPKTWKEHNREFPKAATDAGKGAPGVHTHSGRPGQRRVIDFHRKEAVPVLRKVISAKATQVRSLSS
jgi:F420-dependent hydroxymycolic acid dehydrogenase